MHILAGVLWEILWSYGSHATIMDGPSRGQAKTTFLNT